ncbi:hypothetical protein FKG94_21675 [Exilibacterium tricleocarpae]|uniref:Uncharacterized protein n=1 Tax=Exilibacterium tricleocarpae TaxID=2591008 RepID=A0A545SYT8_9GAMM|nr:hypothetical protein [Exilibacterium tricleocarpae]TQV70136.1 hypothetical protein FKG94_21675 [Exilibacterium tricleocarpae]
MTDLKEPDIYATPDSGKKASALLAGRPRYYPLPVVFLLALAATVILSELYWLAVNISTTLFALSRSESAVYLQGIYSLTSYQVLTSIPAALPDIYSGNIVARRCRKYPYHCLAAVYVAVLIYLNRSADVGLSYVFIKAVAIDLIYVGAAFASLHYYRRKYDKAAAHER